ncbi:MAG: glycosyltransferase family 4 protein [Anaerolineae bacterium]
MRVCYFGTYDLNYARNRILIEGLRRNGIEVVECHAPLWQGTSDKVSAARRAWCRPGLMFRTARAYGALLQQIRSVGDCDALILGYMGQFDTFLARLVANQRQIPLVLDVLMSISLIMRERRLATPGDALDRIVSWVERRACRLADMVWLDTPSYVDYFQERYQLPATIFRLVPIGADDRYYYPVPDSDAKPDLTLSPLNGRPFTVSYVGKYVPLHGIPTIIQAAALMRNEGVHFEMIGDGEARPAAVALAKQLGADNVTFEGWVEKTRLARRLAPSDICLGVFGRQRQGMITIPNKVYEGFAMRKPVITGRTPAVEAAFESGRHLVLVPLEDPMALADAIRRVRDGRALRNRLAEEGYRLYQEHYTPTALGSLAKSHLLELLDNCEL